jgi:hypothetical protein
LPVDSLNELLTDRHVKAPSPAFQIGLPETLIRGHPGGFSLTDSERHVQATYVGAPPCCEPLCGLAPPAGAAATTVTKSRRQRVTPGGPKSVFGGCALNVSTLIYRLNFLYSYAD